MVQLTGNDITFCLSEILCMFNTKNIVVARSHKHGNKVMPWVETDINLSHTESKKTSLHWADHKPSWNTGLIIASRIFCVGDSTSGIQGRKSCFHFILKCWRQKKVAQISRVLWVCAYDNHNKLKYAWNLIRYCLKLYSSKYICTWHFTLDFPLLS